MSTVTYPHIEVREDGKAVIVGERFYFKVRMLVEEFLATGATPNQLREAHPILTLSQIHSALAYYYDHKDAIDGEIAELKRVAEELRPQLENPAITRKLLEARKARKDCR